MLKKTATAVLLVFVTLSLGLAFVDAFGLRHPAQAPEPAPSSDNRSDRWVAYYFHTNTRCPTCRKIEANGQAAVADAVREGRVEWRAVNYQDPVHAHYAQDFGLEFASIVLVREVGGRTVRWKKLDQTWDFFNDPAGFTAYVRQELARFTEEQP
jgi:hypothetical protein